MATRGPRVRGSVAAAETEALGSVRMPDMPGEARSGFDSPVQPAPVVKLGAAVASVKRDY